jgi:hypothetical protein
MRWTQSKTISRPVGLSAVFCRTISPSASSRRKARWTVPTERPIRAPIDASDGQHTALARDQKSRARSTAFSVGVISGRPAIKWGRAAKGSRLVVFSPGGNVWLLRRSSGCSKVAVRTKTPSPRCGF